MIFLFILSGLSILLISLELTEKISAIRNLVYYFLSPSSEIALRIVNKSQILGENIISFVKTHQENQKLKKQIEELELIHRKYETLLRENTEIKALLNIQKRIHYKVFSARVIGRDPTDWFKTILIDTNGLSLVKRNLPVININKNQICLLGRVIDVQKSTAKVLLLTDPLSNVPAKVTRSGETGVIVGQGSSDLILDYLLPESDIKIGDKVITSGIGEIFPEGIPIGTVYKIYSKDNTYFKKAIVKPFISWNKINFVLVIQK
ncbi:MAG: rod shape-determining protein MreC [Endomicrobiia bacterium]